MIFYLSTRKVQLIVDLSDKDSVQSVCHYVGSVLKGKIKLQYSTFKIAYYIMNSILALMVINSINLLTDEDHEEDSETESESDTETETETESDTETETESETDSDSEADSEMSEISDSGIESN